MQPSDYFFDFLAHWEGEKLCPYRDKAGVPTIGIGSTFYENGASVKMTDVCITHERAIALAKSASKDFTAAVNSLTAGVSLNQNQFDALLCFTYNQGKGAFKSSTLLKKVNKNPNDPSIRDEFAKWVYVFNPKTGKKERDDWQIKRRKGEADLYFKPVS